MADGADPGLVSELKLDVAAFARDAESLGVLESYFAGLGGRTHLAKGGVEQASRWLEAAPAPPRLLLVDIGGAGAPLSRIDRLAEVCEPSVVVVAIGEEESVGLFRELIRAGIADYVTKPLSSALLDPYVRERRDRIAPIEGPARRGKVVAVTGARGGVGATTLAAATARALSEKWRRRVALVDLDLRGGAAAAQLGAQPGGLADALRNWRRLDPVFLDRVSQRVGSRLTLLTEEQPLEAVAEIEPAALQALLEALSEEHHFVVLDLPAGGGAFRLPALRAARQRIIVADRSLPAIRDAGRLLEAMRDTLAPTLLALNDRQPRLAGGLDAARIGEAVGRRPDLEIAHDRKAAGRAENLGEFAERGPLADGVEALARALTGRPRPRRGALARLLGRRA